MQNITENETIIHYIKLLEDEFNHYLQQGKDLYSFAEIIRHCEQWKFSKDSSVLYPHPFFNELLGYKPGKFARKKFTSLAQAVEEKYAVYGLDKQDQHLFTIIHSSQQFGTGCDIYIHQDNLIKKFYIDYNDCYFIENDFYCSYSNLPKLKGLRYFFWLDNATQVILNKGISSKITNISIIQYQDNKPYKIMPNIISQNGKLDIMEFIFNYQDEHLLNIKHCHSDYMMYENKTLLKKQKS